jgi:hypothetical protein
VHSATTVANLDLLADPSRSLVRKVTKAFVSRKGNEAVRREYRVKGPEPVGGCASD